MASQENDIWYSIGEERNDRGEPLFCVAGKGALGTVDDVKKMIARYERHALVTPSASNDLATAIRHIVRAEIAIAWSDPRARG